MKVKFIFALMLSVSSVFFSACEAQKNSAEVLIGNVESELRTYLFSKYDDFQICRIFSKYENKKLFLKNSLGGALLDGVVNVNARELYFKELPAETESHLGRDCCDHIFKQRNGKEVT